MENVLNCKYFTEIDKEKIGMTLKLWNEIKNGIIYVLLFTITQKTIIKIKSFLVKKRYLKKDI